ncbi:type I restriction-modification system subunit M [Phnomibacter sp. MR]|uniref:type I restriction-modification system subunit M n=1 Tax=Phnomibacter sp. MR TaxID=3042318 RepID=UPI003A8111FF
MAIKKSELYSSLWEMCDELRGGMDASEYKDYVLIMLFIKYISDKYAGVPYAPITVPEGASFKDMVALKGKDTIGDDINKKIIGPIEQANKSLGSIKVDFDNPEKLGTGDEKVKRLTKLIAIFEKPELNFSKNKAEGDDILGDAYEYLMRNFATESGKSKGQFYTPSEVSRIMAKIIGINNGNANANTTIYDPTCGSGSLLLKVADEAERKITIYGQEKESATAGLARMNMVLHDCPTALIKCTGNSTLSDPQFTDDNGGLKQFDFVVANPPFSLKNWTNGVYDTDGDIGVEPSANGRDYGRFKGFGIPPDKNGDYAFLLHIIRSLKSKGKAAVILPHGVLFRGNAEAEIRKNLIKRGYIKGIIGLPANLFYGTGIPACLIIIDKENADSRKAIFMMDASKGYVKDGPKNRLRDQDIHKIVDTFNKLEEADKYSRIVPISEIEEKEYNLNIPRYIDSQEPEDIQDIAAHLQGGIPNADIDALNAYWQVYPTMRDVLFAPHQRSGYSLLKIDKANIKTSIFEHPEFTSYSKKVFDVYDDWKAKTIPVLKGLKEGVKPKILIHEIAEDLLATFSNLQLIDKYDAYQHLMTYWNEVMQDDVFVISDSGWQAGREVYRIVKTSKDKSGKTKEKEQDGLDGMESKLIQPYLIVNRYFLAEKHTLEALEGERETTTAELEQLEEEHGVDGGLLNEARNENDKITTASVKERMKRIKGSKDDAEEYQLLQQFLKLSDAKTELGKKIATLQKELETKVWNQYKALTDEEIISLVVDDKWIPVIDNAIRTEMQRISQRLTQRIKELADRYETPLPAMEKELAALEAKVQQHLAKMGF